LVLVQEADGGIVTDVRVVEATHDSALLVSAVERHIEVFADPPVLAAVDRGFFSPEGRRFRRSGAAARPRSAGRPGEDRAVADS
jgi:hypothetical protein